MKYYRVTKNGKKIDVDEMDIGHLRNVVKMFIKMKQNYECPEQENEELGIGYNGGFFYKD